jgi:hypothetical protein
MNTPVAKNSSRKAMRVATVFAGVSACATAAAFAMAGHTQATPKTPPRPLPGTARTVKLLANQECSSGTVTWFHLYYMNANGGGSSSCIGGVGHHFVGTSRWSGFCGGNNHGDIYGYSVVNGDPRTQPFHHGSSEFRFRPPVYPDSKMWIGNVYISGWNGGTGC